MEQVLVAGRFGSPIPLTLTTLAEIPYLVRFNVLSHGERAPFSLLVAIPWIPQEDGLVATVAERVKDIVAEQLGVEKDKISPETSFVNDLGADSLDQVELVMELEEEFDINIPDDAAEKIQTVGQAIKFIEEAQQS